jgi:hypothetical protein
LGCHDNSYFFFIIATLYPVLGDDHYYLVRVECMVRGNESGCLIKKLLYGLD